MLRRVDGLRGQGLDAGDRVPHAGAGGGVILIWLHRGAGRDLRQVEGGCGGLGVGGGQISLAW